MRHLFPVLIVAIVLLGSPPATTAQSLPMVPTPPASAVSENPSRSGLFAGWELSLDGRVGVPRGSIQVGEDPVPGTHLRLHRDLGLKVSEAVEASVAYHLTPRDAVRFTYLQYFLDGSATIDHPFAYNGPTFGPGHVDSSVGFYRLSLAYERSLWVFGNGAQLTGSAGATYVSLDAVVHSNHEDFYRQELPVPIVGLRLLYPLGEHLMLTADVSGGGLPRVNSLRQEGGTIYLQQSHADAGLGIAYALTPLVQVRAGYHFTYFFQHEKSHEDDNRFELLDNGLQLGLTVRF